MNAHRSPGWWRVTVALAGCEGRRLITSPVVLVGLVFAAAGGAMFLGSAFSDRPGAWSDDGWTLHVGMFVMGLFVMVATNRAALRDRREHAVEQNEAIPTSRSVRSAGLVLASVWPAVAGAVVMIGAILVAGTRLAVPTLEPIVSAQRIVVLVMFGALGVALAAWAPQPFFASLVAFALFAAAPPETPEPWHVVFPHAVIETAALSLWHIGFLLGMTALFASLAVARTLSWRLGAAAIAGSLVVVGVSIAVLMTNVCPAGQPCLL